MTAYIDKDRALIEFVKCVEYFQRISNEISDDEHATATAVITMLLRRIAELPTVSFDEANFEKQPSGLN